MIWLSWRQFRAQGVTACVALVPFAAFVVWTGLRLRDDCAAECVRAFQGRLYLLDAVLLALPAVLGMFWGAPLVARELEAGTHRTVWNQSVSRRRWLLVKLLFTAACAAVLAGACSALLTWAAAPYDRLAADRFTALIFGARNVAPVAYAAFAVVLGALLGLVLRRTLPAMALTAAAFVAVQVAMPTLVRPHLVPPVTADARMTVEVLRNLRFLGADASIEGLSVPGGWVTSTSKMRRSNGDPVDLAHYGSCISASPDLASQCIAALDLHVRAEYQPAGRYWRFQWLEVGLFAAMTATAGALGLWRVRRRPD
ncbi:transporter [Virgisporangium aliadipatigenens]|uniref:Transporter n=1 Tax=Virgisporangium aliadipatigenens TaxID=741659 RepID=A0A8J3YTL3_9ACTN|nr:ABC transporter permease subunit [Virgisporangium aliadipatigenens]GIJ49523.1 transporter [Virgisporangium aliadipatigenens]